MSKWIRAKDSEGNEYMIQDPRDWEEKLIKDPKYGDYWVRVRPQPRPLFTPKTDKAKKIWEKK